MECVNLLGRFGQGYRITYDPTDIPKHRHRANLDPWMMQIDCRCGIIYPHGGTLLAVEVDSRPTTARRLLESGVCTLYQDGNREKTLTFDVAVFEAVAAIVKLRRRRRLTEEQKKAAIENLKQYWM